MMRPTPKHEFVRFCQVHLPARGDIALVAAMWNHDGLFAEKEGGVEKCAASDSDVLGQMIERKLAECEYRQYFDYSRDKSSAWPAYRASGIRTIKEFEATYVGYGVSGANEASITWVVTSPDLPNGVRLEVTVSAGVGARRIGDSVRELHDFFLRVRQQHFS